MKVIYNDGTVKELDSKEEELSFEGNDYMDSISLIDIK